MVEAVLRYAFFTLVVARLLSALVNFNTLSDCDEVMNYWEPTHYLLTGKGLQTWEYSPEFGLRSYSYIGLHAMLAKLFIILTGNKVILRRASVLIETLTVSIRLWLSLE